MTSPEPDSVAINRESWTRANAEHTDASAARQWAAEAFTWGTWGVPESDLRTLGEVTGRDVVELGCGTAYVSAWLARLGARPVGVDPTPAQLETARRLQRETGIEFPLVEAPGEDVPLPDASFDLVVSEYGASLWADPERWVPEAARLLRSGGRLVFLTNAWVAFLCMPDTDDPVGEQLVRPQFGAAPTVDWRSIGGGIEFHLAHGEWIELLRRNGFEILALHELQAPPEAQTHEHYDWVTADWAKRWPSEEIWVARKIGP
jgi:SAM-dependent methyltransferase